MHPITAKIIILVILFVDGFLFGHLSLGIKDRVLCRIQVFPSNMQSHTWRCFSFDINVCRDLSKSGGWTENTVNKMEVVQKER